MFDSAILDVMVGLVFVFLTVSLVSSTLTEGLASLFKLRSSTLLGGLKSILNDSGGVGIVKDLYNHALINPRDVGTRPDIGSMAIRPAYITPTQFADAMIEVTGLLGKAQADMTTVITNSGLHNQTKQLLLGMIKRADNDEGKLHAELAGWFDSAMDRVSGAYKRMTQVICLIVALALTVALNIDSLRVAKALWLQPTLVKSIATGDAQDPKAAFDTLESLNLPIGWTSPSGSPGGESTLTMIIAQISVGTVVGWLITALSTLFGAPFWYDTLQSFVRIKGTGPSPGGKSTGNP
jgi:hypothetical protein